MKKIIALCLSFSMLAGIMSVPAMAEKVAVNIPAETVVEQSFAGELSAVPAGWTLSGNYTFGEKGIKAVDSNGFTLYKDEAFDAGEAGYTFSTKFAHYTGGNYLHIGASSVADAIKAGVSNTGYTMKTGVNSNGYKSGVYTIYKNGVEIGSLTDTNTSYGYQSNRTFTFTVTNEGLTVTGAGDTFTYADAEPIKSGYIGIKLVDKDAKFATLASMSLNTDEYAKEKEGPEDVSTAWMSYLADAKVFMDIDLRGATEVPEGVTTTETETDKWTWGGASGPVWSNNKLNRTVDFGNVEIPEEVSEFTLEASYKAYYANSPKLNFLGYTLEKSGAYNGNKTYTLKKGSEVLATGVYEGTGFVNGNVPVKVTFKNNKITVSVNGKDVIVDAEDTAVSKSGKVSVESGYVEKFTVGYLKITSPKTIVSKADFLYEKTFSDADTKDSLAAEGYTVSGNSLSYDAEKGIVNGKDGSLEAYFDGATFSGGYVLEAVAGRSMNNGTVYFNRQDADTYYSVNTKVNNASSSILQIAKVVDGVSTSLLTNEEGAVVVAGSISMPVAGELLNKITLNPQENGDLEITAEFINSNGTTRAVTVTDKKTETSSPLYYGGFGYANSWSGVASNYIKSFKVYPAESGSEDEPEIPEQPVTGAVATYAGPLKTYMDIDLRGVESCPEGVTVTDTDTDKWTWGGESGPVWSNRQLSRTVNFGNVEIPEGVSEFTVEASYKAYYANSPKFNFLGYTLEKLGQYNGDKTYTLKKGTEVIAEGVYEGTGFVNGNVPVKVTFKNNKITVSVNGKNVIVDAEDAAVSKSGKISVDSGYVENFTVGYAKVTSSNVSKTSFLLDKKFSAADTSASLAEDGYSIKGATGYVNDKGIVNENEIASNKCTLSVNYTGATFEGAYTLEVVAAKTMNEGRVYFNRADAKNYYIVKTKSGEATKGTLWIQKVADGVATSLLTNENGEVVESVELGIGTNGRVKYTISTEPVSNGDLVFNVNIENAEGKSKSYTITDKKTETNVPFVSGTIGYENSYSGADNNRVESFRVYPTEFAENAVYTGEFNVNGEAAAAFVKGNTTFEFPVAMLGQTPDFIAALYEDNKMTAVKVFDVYDINAGAVSLFDTSASTAEEISMAVYVWNDVDELVPVLEEFELK